MKVYEVIFHYANSDESESEVLDAKNDADAVKEAMDLLSEFKLGVIKSCYIEHGQRIIVVL